MKRLSTALTLALLAGIQTSGFASENRLRAMGGERRLLVDNGAIHLYPTAANDFPHFAVEVFEEWGGGVYTVGTKHAVGVFLNRSSPELSLLNDRLDGRGSALFDQLQLQPRADVIYAFAIGSGLRLALATSYSFDELRRGQSYASASNWDVRLGMQVGATDRQHLRATVGVSQQDLEDRTAGGARAVHTDGNGYSLEARGHIPLAANVSFTPATGVRFSAYDLEPAVSEFVDIDILLGLNLTPARRVKIIAGLGVRYLEADRQHPVNPDLKQTRLTLPSAVFGGEMQVGSLLFRVGVRHANVSVREEVGRGTTLAKNEEFESRFSSDFGLGFSFGPVLLDGLIERDFLRDGPHFLGGSRRGGGIFSELSLTYYLDD